MRIDRSAIDREALLRKLVPTVYFLPAVVGILTLILFAVPRFGFVFLGEEHEFMSLFTLLESTWESCQAALRSTDVYYETIMFSRTMIAYSIAFWVLLVAYLFFVLWSCACAAVAFANKPTSDLANQAKKLFVFACFNRPVYVAFQLMPVLLAFFPRILLSQYKSKLGMIMTVSYQGLSTPVILLLAVTLSALVFLLSLSAQRTLHLDMFRFYKRRSSED